MTPENNMNTYDYLIDVVEGATTITVIIIIIAIATNYICIYLLLHGTVVRY